MSPWTPVFQFLGIDQFVVSTIILCLLFTFVGLALGAFLCNGTKNKKAALARASSAMAALLIAAIVAPFRQPRKRFVNARDRPLSALAAACQPQVLVYSDGGP